MSLFRNLKIDTTKKTRLSVKKRKKRSGKRKSALGERLRQLLKSKGEEKPAKEPFTISVMMSSN